jgi:tRNA dimethylallyltransferase
MQPRPILLAGPTATGKSRLAVQLAQRLGAEIINADSQQVYRGLDIGTGKPTLEERGTVTHHLFDVAEAWEQFNAAQFIAAAAEAMDWCLKRGRPAIVVGGTGLWLRALLRGLVDAPPGDPEVRARLKDEAARLGLEPLHARLREVDPASAETIRPSDPVRIMRALEVFELAGVPLSVLHERHRALPPKYEALQLGVDVPREVLDPRITARAVAMFEQGLVEETQAALRDPRRRDRLERTMGYREALGFIEGKLSREKAVAAAALAQRQYSRRQRTWFKSEPEWRWLAEAGRFDQALEACERWLVARPVES